MRLVAFCSELLLLKPCRKQFRKRKGPVDKTELSINMLYAKYPPETEEKLDEDLDRLVSKIDGTNPSIQDKGDSTSICNSSQVTYEEVLDNNDSPRLYNHCETTSVNSHGIVAIMSDKSSEVEVADLRSFDVEDLKFADYNCKDLARNHSSINVRNCNSRTCGTCNKEEDGVYFVKTKKPEFISFST